MEKFIEYTKLSKKQKHAVNQLRRVAVNYKPSAIFSDAKHPSRAQRKANSKLAENI